MRERARESIHELFELAADSYDTHPERSHRYVTIARNISMRTRTRIPRHLRRRFCKNCHHYLSYGKNCRIRTRNNKVIITCLDCGTVMRIPFMRERKTKRCTRR